MHANLVTPGMESLAMVIIKTYMLVKGLIFFLKLFYYVFINPVAFCG